MLNSKKNTIKKFFLILLIFIFQIKSKISKFFKKKNLNIHSKINNKKKQEIATYILNLKNYIKENSNTKEILNLQEKMIEKSKILDISAIKSIIVKICLANQNEFLSNIKIIFNLSNKEFYELKLKSIRDIKYTLEKYSKKNSQ